MEITENQREQYIELAIRLRIAYNSYSMGNKSMDYHRKRYTNENNIDDYWIKLAIKIQKDMSLNIESIFFGN